MSLAGSKQRAYGLEAAAAWHGMASISLKNYFSAAGCITVPHQTLHTVSAQSSDQEGNNMLSRPKSNQCVTASWHTPCPAGTLPFAALWCRASCIDETLVAEILHGVFGHPCCQLTIAALARRAHCVKASTWLAHRNGSCSQH